MLGGRVRTGEWLAGAGGAGLLVVLFLPWYGPEPLSGWEAFSVVDLLLGLTALLGLAVPMAAAVYRTPAIPVSVALITAGVGIVMTLLVGYRLLNEPGPDDLVSLHTGAYAGLLGVLAIAAGGWLAMADERTAVAEVVPVPARAAPPAHAPAGSTVARAAADARDPLPPGAGEPPS